MTWTKQQILSKLRQLHRKGEDLSYNAVSRSMQPVVSAAAYHFGSYRKAIEAAGIDYADITRRPRWTKDNIAQVIRDGAERGDDLHWAAVTRRRDELGKAAFAALQPRLFGSWEKALIAAGLKPEQVARYRRWTEKGIVTALKKMHRQNEPCNSGAVQDRDPGLHAAALRQFHEYDNALRAAGIDPNQVRKRREWTRDMVIQEIKDHRRKGLSLSGTEVRIHNLSLYGAGVRLFGTFAKARQAAGIEWKRGYLQRGEPKVE